MKIVLISPKGPLYRHRGGIFKKIAALRAAHPDHAGGAGPPRAARWRSALIDEGIAGRRPLDLEADLVGHDGDHRHAPRAYELAAHFRARGIPVVLGGPHVTLIPEDAQPHADAIVVGYAEETWPQLLRDFAAGRAARRATTRRRAWTSPGAPSPAATCCPKGAYLTDNVFEATRGCVHNCDFCVVPAAWGTKPFQKPVEEVVADIRQHGARKLIFVDLNLIADRALRRPAVRGADPAQGAVVRPRHRAARPTIRELLALAARSGCRACSWGSSRSRRRTCEQSQRVSTRRSEYARAGRERCTGTASRSRAASSSASTTTRRTSS